MKRKFVLILILLSTLICFLGAEGCVPCIDDDDDGYVLDPEVDDACSIMGPPWDCNDNDAGINPSATEVCDDEIDNDCDVQIDGDDLDCAFLCDVDDDGHNSEECGGRDCDDNNANIHPGQYEFFNDIDDNCNILVDEGLGINIEDATASNYDGAIQAKQLFYDGDVDCFNIGFGKMGYDNTLCPPLDEAYVYFKGLGVGVTNLKIQPAEGPSIPCTDCEFMGYNEEEDFSLFKVGVFGSPQLKNNLCRVSPCAILPDPEPVLGDCVDDTPCDPDEDTQCFYYEKKGCTECHCVEEDECKGSVGNCYDDCRSWKYHCICADWGCGPETAFDKKDCICKSCEEITGLQCEVDWDTTNDRCSCPGGKFICPSEDLLECKAKGGLRNLTDYPSCNCVCDREQLEKCENGWDTSTCECKPPCSDDITNYCKHENTNPKKSCYLNDACECDCSCAPTTTPCPDVPCCCEEGETCKSGNCDCCKADPSICEGTCGVQQDDCVGDYPCPPCENNFMCQLADDPKDNKCVQFCQATQSKCDLEGTENDYCCPIIEGKNPLRTAIINEVTQSCKCIPCDVRKPDNNHCGTGPPRDSHGDQTDECNSPAKVGNKVSNCYTDHGEGPGWCISDYDGGTCIKKGDVGD
ncbi:putative metal-binding motif-containing protein [Nanoarchaeota archaeon]